jgi:hypothetical protein
MRRTLAAIVLLGWLAGCGERPSQLGLLVDRTPFARVRIGVAPDDIVTRDRLPGTDRRFARADLVGDSASEMLVLDPGLQGLEIRGDNGALIGHLAFHRNVTDFAGVPAEGGGKAVVVVNLGGTFLLVGMDGHERARWQEVRDPGRFASGSWQGRAALFYLVDDTLVVRSTEGEALARLPAPEGRVFGRVFVAGLAAGRLVLVASGSGYTPYHMVCVYDASGALMFQEVDDELAFAVAPDDAGRAFLVTTRSSEWRYAPP